MIIEIETINAKRKIRGGSQNTFLHATMAWIEVKGFMQLYIIIKQQSLPLYIKMRYTKVGLKVG